jgi:3-polyprenyl-4-hydroxybenzoate decarboxylase
LPVPTWFEREAAPYITAGVRVIEYEAREGERRPCGFHLLDIMIE